MRLDRLRIQDFFGYDDTEIDLRTTHQAVITGPVGSGKSSIIDAFTWCLYGEARGRTLDELIRHGADTATVTAWVTVDDRRYRVTRSRKRGKDSDLAFEELHEAGVERLTAHTNAETQAVVVDRMGVGYRPLLAGPFMLANDTGALMKVSAAERKQLLLDLRVGGAWATWERRAKTDGAEWAIQVRMADEQLRAMGAVADLLVAAESDLVTATEALALATADAADASKASLDAHALLAAKRSEQVEWQRLTAEVDDVRTRFVAVRKDMEGRERAATEARAAYAALVAPPKPTGDADAIRASRADAMVLVTTTSQALMRLETQTHVRCPSCGADVVCPNGHVLSGPPESQLTAARAFHEGAKAGLVALDTEERENRLATVAWEQHERKASTLAAEVERLTAHIEEGKPIMVDLWERGKAIKARLDEIGDVEDLSPLITAAATAEATHQATQATLTAATAYHARAAERVEAHRLDQERYETLTVQRAEAAARVHVAGVLEKAFGRDGVPTLLLESSLPVMEDRANEVLSRMPGDMRLSIRTQRATQKATLRETMDIIVSVAGVERDYEMLSSGQRARVDLSLRLGLTAVLSQHRIGTLIFDEGLDRWQDPEGRDAVLDTLATVSQDFERVIVVSHQPDVIERFGTRLEVSMEEGVSHVG